MSLSDVALRQQSAYSEWSEHPLLYLSKGCGRESERERDSMTKRKRVRERERKGDQVVWCFGYTMQWGLLRGAAASRLGIQHDPTDLSVVIKEQAASLPAYTQVPLLIYHCVKHSKLSLP